MTRIRSGLLASIGGMLLLGASGAGHAGMIVVNPSLTLGDAYFVGLVDPAHPASLADEASFINNMITLGAGDGPDSSFGDGQTYDRTDSTLVATFATATTINAVKDDGKNETNNSSNLEGVFQYILGKYDGPNFGSLVWYHEEGFSGEATLQGTAGGFELSHIAYFNKVGDTPVPAPATLLLIGFGLLGLGAFARRYRAA